MGIAVLPARRLRPRRRARSPRAARARVGRHRRSPGSRHDPATDATRASFYAGLDLRAVDFTAALRRARPAGPQADRADAPVLRGPAGRPRPRLRRARRRRPTSARSTAWARALRAAGAAEADVLYLHHLTPLNEAAARVAPERPGRRPPPRHRAADARGDRRPGRRRAGRTPRRWAERMRALGAGCERLIVALRRAARARRSRARHRRRSASPSSRTASTRQLRRRRAVDRRALWRRRLVEEPRGWRPGEAPGSVAYERGRARGARRTGRCCSTSAASPRSSACRC